MRITRPLIAAMTIAVAAFALAACGSSDNGGSTGSSSTSGGKDVKRIAFFGFASANSFAQATWAGVQDTAKKEGVQAKFFDPNFDAAKQVSQIQNAIASGQYQAFVVQANDGNAVVPVIKEAINAGIKVVAEFTPVGTRYDTITPQVPGMVFVGEAPTWNGKSLGELGVQACKGVNPCNVAYLEGFKSLPLDNARTNAVKQELATASNVKVVASVEGGYTQASGLKAAQNVLQAHPNVNVMIGSSQAIEGAGGAIKDAGKAGKIKLIGNGGSTQAVSAVKSGDWFAAYVIAERSSGAKAAALAIASARGQKVAPSFDTRKLQNPIGIKANLGSFTGQYDD
ncbi:MAG: ribose transport system substrate-binding protein [Solirubrobacteraceae bacterium]